MNQHEAQRIAAAMNQLRPDWPRRSLLTLLEKNLMDRPRRDVAVALAWVACEAGTSTPARVLESGPWWLAAGVAGDTTGRREPYNPAEFCDVCGKPHGRHPESDHAFVSVVDHMRHLADDEATAEQRKDDARQYARQALGDAKAEPPRQAPEREHKPSEHVDALRVELTPHATPDRAATDEDPAGAGEVRDGDE